MDEFIMMPIPCSSFRAVCALLGAGVSLGAVAAAAPAPAAPVRSAQENIEQALGTGAAVVEQPNAEGAPDLDAAGWPWSADLHASTKGTTKEGLWRMKVGVARPDPKPGFPKATGTGSEAPNGGSAAANAAPASATVEEDDEFATFRAANEAAVAGDAAAKAGVAARKWTDTDLGALCNQAAIKLGDPEPIRALIAQYIPADATAHSRNIPADKREEFAKAIEAKAGIEFAG